MQKITRDCKISIYMYQIYISHLTLKKENIQEIFQNIWAQHSEWYGNRKIILLIHSCIIFQQGLLPKAMSITISLWGITPHPDDTQQPIKRAIFMVDIFLVIIEFYSRVKNWKKNIFNCFFISYHQLNLFFFFIGSEI